MNGPRKGQTALPAQAGTCLTQYGLVLETHNRGQLCVPPRLAPFLALDTRGQSPYVQAGKEANARAARSSATSSAASVQHLVPEQGFSALGVPPSLGYCLDGNLSTTAVRWSRSCKVLYGRPTLGGQTGNFSWCGSVLVWVTALVVIFGL